MLKKYLFIGGLFALSVCAPSSFAEGIGEEGLKIGMTYSAGKSILLKRGWKVSEESRDAVFYNFPEITCGSGFDALCSVEFEKEGAYLAITVERHGSELVITGEY